MPGNIPGDRCPSTQALGVVHNFLLSRCPPTQGKNHLRRFHPAFDIIIPACSLVIGHTQGSVFLQFIVRYANWSSPGDRPVCTDVLFQDAASSSLSSFQNPTFVKASASTLSFVTRSERPGVSYGNASSILGLPFSSGRVLGHTERTNRA